MPSKPRKTPSGHRKKVTASAQARVSTRKIRKKNPNQEGSFLQTGMLSSSSTSSPHPLPVAESQGNHDTILAMLTDIKASNQALAERITKIERQTLESHPNTNQGTQFRSQDMGSSRIVGNTSVAPHVHCNTGSIQGVQDLHPTAGNTIACTTNEHPSSNHHAQVNMGSGLASLPNDSVLPNLETIRRLESVSEAVSNILASYESQN